MMNGGSSFFLYVRAISVTKEKKNTESKRALYKREGGWEAVGQEKATKNSLALSGGCF